MDKYRLPKSIEIAGVECPIDSDFRNILKVFEILNDPDLLYQEAVMLALDWFYTTPDYVEDIETAIIEMFNFINCGEKKEQKSVSNDDGQLYDWDKDFAIIIAPINQILGYDVRGVEYLHWWTFMSAFMQIKECTFSTYVEIRRKLNKGIKLEKYEAKIYKEHMMDIVIPKKYDRETQDLIDSIM